MSDTIPTESEKPAEQESPPAPTVVEAQPVDAQEPALPGAGSGEPQSAARRSRRGVVSLIFGIASIVLAPLVLLPGPVEWVGYLGLVATLIALLAARGALRKHGEADRRERKLAQAGVATGMLGFLALVALFVLVSVQGAQQSTALLTAAMAPPKTFESADFTLSYPGGWTAVDTTQKADCKNPALECLIWLDAPLGDGRLAIVRYPDPGVETAEEADQVFWAMTQAEAPGIELASRQDIQVDQRPAIQRIFRRPASDDPSRRNCMQLITTVSDGAVYQFMGVAGDSAACDGHRAAFDSITQSFDFKAPLAAQATPAPKVYEGENFTLTYPGHWITSEDTAARVCADCPVLVHAYRDGSNIAFNLRHFSVSEKTADQADAAWWKAITDQNSALVLESRQLIKLDQRPAIKRIYHDPGSNSYSMGVVLIDGGEAYILVASALSQEAFDGHRAEFEDIMDNLRFKHPLQSATATPPRPTARPTSAPKNTPAASAQPMSEGDGFTLANPKGWAPVDVEQAPICQGVMPPAKCALVISTPDDESLLVVQRFEMPNSMTAEQLDTAMWTMLEGNDPSLKLESREEIEIDGQPAIKRVASVDDSSSPTGKAYLLLVATVKDNVFYQIMGMSTSAETFEKSLPDMESALASWRFVP